MKPPSPGVKPFSYAVTTFCWVFLKRVNFFTGFATLEHTTYISPVGGKKWSLPSKVANHVVGPHTFKLNNITPLSLSSTLYHCGRSTRLPSLHASRRRNLVTTWRTSFPTTERYVTSMHNYNSMAHNLSKLRHASHNLHTKCGMNGVFRWC